MELRLGGTGNKGIVSKIGTSLFFAVFMVMGLSFLVFMFGELYSNAKTYLWKEAPCEILESSIVKARGGADKFEIRYTYTYKKHRYTSSKFNIGGGRGNSVKLRNWKNKYRKGFKTKCYVNPSNPHDVVIFREINWPLVPFALIPLIFVLVGVIGIVFSWKKSKPKTPVESAAVKARPSAKGVQKGGLCVFFSLFLIIGSIFFWMTVGRPLYKIHQSQDWKRVPCVITTSRVCSSSDSDGGTTYRVDIAFKYKYKGVEYVGGTYDFSTGSNSDGQSKYKVIGRYPVGRSTHCYVNPENPVEAVISREYNEPWWVAVLCSVFVLVGAWGIVGTLIKKKTNKHVYQQDNDAFNDHFAGGETVLKVKNSSLKAFLAMIFVAAFWNGIVSLFVTEAVKSWGTDNVEWFLSFFMIPFVLIGLFFIVLVVYFFIALFNSRVTVTVSNPRPRLGETLAVSWRIADSTAVNKLCVYLQAVETAIYTKQSKDSNSRMTVTRVVEQITLMDSDSREAIQSGREQVTIPLDSMHSFDAKNTKLTWQFLVHGNIKWRPDIKNEYVINVLPMDENNLHKVSRTTDNEDGSI